MDVVVEFRLSCGHVEFKYILLSFSFSSCPSRRAKMFIGDALGSDEISHRKLRIPFQAFSQGKLGKRRLYC